MLSEQRSVRQVPGERQRRFFSDEEFDLIVWEEPDGAIAAFQLCYDKKRDERALTWKRDGGFSHHRIDSGGVVCKPRTPILVEDGAFPARAVAVRFAAASGGIDPAIARFVAGAISRYLTGA